jgi:hypothetical protein
MARVTRTSSKSRVSEDDELGGRNALGSSNDLSDDADDERTAREDAAEEEQDLRTFAAALAREEEARDSEREADTTRARRAAALPLPSAEEAFARGGVVKALPRKKAKPTQRQPAVDPHVKPRHVSRGAYSK